MSKSCSIDFFYTKYWFSIIYKKIKPVLQILIGIKIYVFQSLTVGLTQPYRLTVGLTMFYSKIL